MPVAHAPVLHRPAAIPVVIGLRPHSDEPCLFMPIGSARDTTPTDPMFDLNIMYSEVLLK